MLLSALIFPGLGQLYNQDRKKGVVLVLLANLLLAIMLLAAVVLVFREYYEVFFPAPLTWEIIKQLGWYILFHPLFYLPFGLLLVLWVFATVDAGCCARPQPPEES